jgi:hypothetical protein
VAGGENDRCLVSEWIIFGIPAGCCWVTDLSEWKELDCWIASPTAS